MDHNTKFTIRDSVRKNTGIYKIIAENVHGRDEADVEVVVLGKFGAVADLGKLCTVVGLGKLSVRCSIVRLANCLSSADIGVVMCVT